MDADLQIEWTSQHQHRSRLEALNHPPLRLPPSLKLFSEKPKNLRGEHSLFRWLLRP